MILLYQVKYFAISITFTSGSSVPRFELTKGSTTSVDASLNKTNTINQNT